MSKRKTKWYYSSTSVNGVTNSTRIVVCPSCPIGEGGKQLRLSTQGKCHFVKAVMWLTGIFPFKGPGKHISAQKKVDAVTAARKDKEEKIKCEAASKSNLKR